MGALQKLGADKCDQCGEWELDTWCLYDHCMCKSCLEGNPEGPLSDDGLEKKEWDEMCMSIVRYLTSRGLKVHIGNNLFKEELKAAYQKVCV